jgi:alpha/beta superfamily hydrolase
MPNPPRSPFGLPRRDDDEPDGAAPAPGEESPEDLTLSIKGVRAREGEAPGELLVELNTTRGTITVHLSPCEGKTGVAVFLGGAAGGVRGPADAVYVRLARDLVDSGVTAVRVEYRDPGEFEECVLDALAACSFVKGIGAERVVLVGHSFGGAVAVKAGELSPLTTAVCSLSAQRYGTFEVDVLGKPLLLIHGSRDEVLDQQASKDIYERAKEPKRLVILEGSGHGLLEHRDEVFTLVRDFVLEHAGDAAL